MALVRILFTVGLFIGCFTLQGAAAQRRLASAGPLDAQSGGSVGDSSSSDPRNGQAGSPATPATNDTSDIRTKPPRKSACQRQLSNMAGDAAQDQWIDPTTPGAQCTVQLCTDNQHAVCDVDNPPLSKLQLVFSEEFNTPGQSFGPGDNNPKWTAERMWYAGTYDEEVYLPEQVSTRDGAAVITIDRTGAANATAPSQQADGRVWNVSKAYKSGFVSSWNKFCFTGGYLEARMQLPGDDFASGFWPATWLMGNLARAGYLQTTAGMWPYSYNTCGGGDVATWLPNGPTPQNISACPDPPGFNRTLYGLHPGQGRGAPEIDLLEVKVDNSTGHTRGEAQGGAPGQQHAPFNSMTLQTAPLLPNGTTWTAKFGEADVPGPGQYLPTRGLPAWMYTHITWWQGAFGSTLLDRPGNLYEDSVSAYATLEPSFWTTYHTFGVDWSPGKYVRWYIDGHLAYEVAQEALRAQTNASGATTGERLIPYEPMYILFNLALSNSFAVIDWEQLAYPAEFKIDYIRVYQSPDSYNVGCSPPDYPTEQYLACNRDKFIIKEEDQVLIPGACTLAKTCRQEYQFDYVGGDLVAPDGNNVSFLVNNVKECCMAAQGVPEAGAYTFVPAPVNRCYLKKSSGWTRVPADGVLSGVVLDKGSLVPRDTTTDAASVATSSVPTAGTNAGRRLSDVASSTRGGSNSPAPALVSSSSGGKRARWVPAATVVLTVVGGLMAI